MKAPLSGKQYGNNDNKKGTVAARSYSPSRSKEAPSNLRLSASSPERRDSTKRRLGNQDSAGSLASLASSNSGSSRASGGGGSRKDTSPSGRGSKKQDDERGPKGAPTVRHSVVLQAKLAEALPAEREDLLLSNLEICTVIYDFRSDTLGREKELKRQTLAALIEHMSTATKDTFTEAMMRAAVKMVSANLFRILEFRVRSPIDMLEFDDEEPFMDVAWPHLQLVYEFLRLFFSCKELDTKLAAKFFDAKFLARLLALLDSDDNREREAIKSAMQKYYSRFTNMRSVARKAYQFACVRAAHETECPNGLSELLELQSKVIHGFSGPLKPEQVELLTKVLIPLHKLNMYVFFYRQLTQCMTQFAEKDASLVYDIVKAMLWSWPYTCGSKQVLFLEELETLLAMLPSADFRRLREQILQRIIACITCPNSLVAERALQLWSTSSFVKVLSANREAMFPSIISALYRNATEHWYGPVHGRTFDVLKVIMETDELLFAESSATHRRLTEDRERVEGNRMRKWRLLHDLHEKKERIAASAKPKPKPKAAGKAKGKAKGKLQKVDSVEKEFRQETTPLPNVNYGVSVSAHDAVAIACMDLQAIIVDTRGDVVSVVSHDNFSALKAAVVHAPGTELVIMAPQQSKSSSGDSEENGIEHGIADNSGASALTRRQFKPGFNIWLTLPRLPANVSQIIFALVTVDKDAARKSPLKACTLRLIDGDKPEEPVSFTVEGLGAAGVALLAVVDRPLPEGPFSFARLAQPPAKGGEVIAKSGSHFSDALDLVGSIVREVVPRATKPQRASLILEPGAVADQLQTMGPKDVFWGAGWDFSNRGYPDERLSVDVAAVMFDSSGKDLGVVSSENPSDFGVRHSGSGMLSAGVVFSFEGVSKEVTQIFLVANVSTDNMTCEMLQNPTCRLIDANGVHILQFAISECLYKPGLILGRISLEPGRRKWCFQAIGRFCGGRTWQDEATMREMRVIYKKSLIDFQQQLDNAKPVAPTSSGRLLASI